MRTIYSIWILALFFIGNPVHGSSAGAKRNIIIDDSNNSYIKPTDALDLSIPGIRDQAPVITYTKSDVKCYGDLSGAIDITVSGSLGTVNYAWTDGPTTEDRSNLPYGTYTITVTDDNGSATQSITVEQPTAPLGAIITSQEVVACFGQSTGSVVITPAGGTPPYVISPAQTGLAAGTHTFTITDSNGCSTTTDVTITQPTATLTATVSSQINVLCFGQATGATTITPAGGTPPYVISPAQTGLAAGTHTFTITDSNGCSTTTDVTITQPTAALTATLTSQVNVSCFGQSTGSAVITPAGGTPPYVITPAQTGLAAGTHTFTITDSNGCSTTTDVTITQPAVTLSASLTSKVDVACFGQSTGSVVITPSGGTPPYVISPAQSGLAAGTHTFTITDSNGCSTTTDVTITQPTATLTATLTSQVNVSCFGQSTGSAVITPAGGTPPYVISPAQTGLAAGTHTFTITDSNGCSTTADVTITQPTAALTATLTSQVNVSCFGQSTGSAVITPAEGTPPYVITPAQTGLAAGTHTFTITDSNGCLTTTDVTITQPTATLTATVSSQINVLCFGQSTGSVVITPAGGTPPYVISPAQTGLAAGTHTFTITDSNGCSTTTDVTITQPTAALTATLTSQVNVSCFGQSTGSAVITPAGGTPPYVISPAQTGLAAGTHTFTITDSNGCSTTTDVTISQPTATLTATLTSQVNVACFGQSTGSAVITPAGGTPPYVISPAQTGLAAGTHTFTITDSNGCSTTTDVTISQPQPLSISNISSNTPVCQGSTINLTVSATGGTPTYSYIWTGPNGFTSTIQNPGIPNSLPASSGTYSVSVSDANSCTASLTTPVTVNPTPVVTASPTSQIICTGATTNIALSGTVPGTTFTWTAMQTSGTISGFSNGSGNNISQTLINSSSSQAIITYTITPSANGCIGTPITVNITVNPDATITLTSLAATKAQAICINTPLTNITYAIGGSGTGVTISSGALPAGVTGNYAGGVYTISGTPTVSGTFLYALTTTGPCIQASVSGTISAFPIPTVTSISDHSFCINVSTPAITVSGPVPGTIFNWTNNNPAIGLVASGTGNIPSFNTTNNTPAPITALITITPSANGCIGSPVTFTITVNPAATLNTPLTSNICSGSPFSYSPGSLTTGATFTWSRSARAGISNTASSGTGNINETLINVTSNPIIVTYIYTLTVNSCTNVQNVLVTVIPAPTLTSTLNPSDVCSSSPFNYTPSFTISGTTATWTRAVVAGISNPAGSGTGSINETLINTSAVDVDVIYVYTLNAAGCINTQNVTVKIKSTPVLSSSLTPPAICSNSTFLYTPASTTTGTAFTWTRAAISGINSNLPGGGTNGISEVLINSTANPIAVTYVYTLRVTTCQNIQNVVVIVNPAPTAAISGNTTVCLNGSNPDITFTGSGGPAPYTFTYKINGGANQTITTLAGTSVKVSAPTSALGIYAYDLVSVSDANGCSQNQTGSAAVTITSLPNAAISGTAVVCQNSAPAPLVTFTGSNGSAPYAFVYQINGGANLTATTLSGNTVTVTAPTGSAGTFVYSLVSVSSAAGCAQAQAGSVTITVNALPTITITTDSTTLCLGGSTTLTAAGATTYTWSPATGLSATTGASVTANPSGTITYTVTGTNSNSCVSNAAVTVTVNPLPVITITPASPSICAGGTVTLTANGGDNYEWSPVTGLSATNTATVGASPAATTTYTVTGTVVNKCKNTKTVTVNVNAIPELTSPVNLTHICSGTAFSYTPTATPATGVTFSWTRPAVAGNPAVTGTGNINDILVNNTTNPIAVVYVYTLTTAGCSVDYDVSVVVVPPPIVTVGASPTSVCYGATVSLTSSSNLVPLPPTLLTENFNGATSWTTTNASTGGTPANAAWTLRPNGYNVNVTYHSNDNSQFYLSDSRTQNGAITSTTLTSPAINTVGYIGLSLNFYQYYVFNGSTGESAKVQVSTDGTTWTTLKTYVANIGTSAGFVLTTIDLSAYVGKPALYIRYFYYSGTRARYWAIDNVTVTGTSASVSTMSWSSNPAGLSATTANTTAILSSTTTYTATYIDLSTNCPGSASVTVTGIPPADASITADYCSVPGYVRLTAHPGPAGFSYSWSSRPETTQSINVNMVSNYQVLVTDLGTGCTGIGTLPVSNELVVGGSFTNFNPAAPSFVTEYTQHQSYYDPAAANPSLTGLWPEGDYAVNIQAWYNNPASLYGYHPNFHGRDHTNNAVGPRNFLMVNGSTTLISNPPRQMIIWQQTVSVKPNSDYYFSAWAMNLNPVSPAQLQFEVNGVLVGSVADLNVAAKPSTEQDVNLTNWVMFYSTPKWNSGSATTAVIRIRNLNTVAGGNDFGLDDISFGSLDPAPAVIAPTISGTICAGGTISLYPHVSGGKQPYHFSWTGPNGFSSSDSIPVIPNATPSNSGTYTLSLVDGYGCAPVTGSVSVLVNGLPACSITGVNTICPNSTGHVFTGPAGMLTYSWSITNGTIVGATNGQSVTVTAGATCNNPMVLTLTVTDANCPSTCAKTIPFQDITAWTTAPGSLNRLLDCSDAAGLATAQNLVPTATSSCTPVINPVKTSGAFVPGACPQSGTYTNTWTFNDACGNAVSSAFIQVITIADSTAPVWTTPFNSLDRSLSCTDTAGLANALALSPLATDACASAVTYSIVADVTTRGACAGTFTRIRTWTAKDNCNNISTLFTQTIIVTDNQPPVWDQAPLALDATFDCANTGGLAAALAKAPTATDACGSGITIVLVTDNNTPGNCTGTFTRIREWTASDGCSNTSAKYKQTIIVHDITPPTWVTPPGELDVFLECSDAAGIAVARALSPVASDFCDADVTNLVKISGTFVPGTCPSAGSYTNTWTVTDDCGNKSSVYTQVITLEDNTLPDIVRPADVAISCSDLSDPSATGTATATDNCDPTPILSYTDIQTPGSCASNFTLNRTWKAVDKCGNTSYSLQRIIVQDVDPPVITCQVSGNQTVDTNSGNVYLHSGSSWNASATDGCSTFTLTASLSGATSGSALTTLNSVSFNIGVTTVTWSAIDACGNETSCSFTVTVNAGADLSVTIAALPVTVTLGQNLTYTIWVKNLGPSTATNIVVSETIPAGLTLVSFTSNVGSWNGSSSWLISNLAFNDVATLTITAKADLNHCSGFTNTVSVTSPTIDPDISNNTATEFTPVIDSTDPVISTCPVTRLIAGCSTADITGPLFSAAVANSSYAEFSDVTNQGVAADNCGITWVTYQDLANTGAPVIVTRTWTLGDAAGNKATCPQQIEVADTIPPTFTAAPQSFCVENLTSAVYISDSLKINPDPDYYLFRVGSKFLDLDVASFHDNCCANNSLIINWRIDFADTPNQIPPPMVLTHASISGTGQPSAFGSDIKVPGDGVTYLSVVHTITYWLTDCNGNKSAGKTINITVNPRPNVKISN